MKKNIKLYAFIVLAFYACKVTKEMKEPEPAVPAAFRNAAALDTTSIGDIQWKSYFTDATLQKLIDSAIVKNYDMQVAVKNIEAAQLVFSQVKYNYLPSANANVTAGINRPSDNSINGLSASQFLGSKHIEDYTAAVALNWEADIWGKIRNQKNSAWAQYLQTREAKKAIQTNIIANVSQGFYNLLILDAQLAIARQNLALNDSTLLIIRLQYNAGQLTSLAIQQAEAQPLVAAQLIPQFEQEKILQENAISILTGELPGTIVTNTSLALVPIKDSLSAGIPAALINRRPDVRSFELALAIANANVGITKANMYPSLTITASGGLNAF